MAEPAALNSAKMESVGDLIRRRILASKGRGDTYVKSIKKISVPFLGRTEEQMIFDIAYALKRYLIYRTDGGNIARSMVKNSVTWPLVIEHYRSNYSSYSAMRLDVEIWRRSDESPNDRWAIYLIIKVSDLLVEEGEELIIRADSKRMEALRSRAAKRIIDCLAESAENTRDAVLKGLSVDNNPFSDIKSRRDHVEQDVGLDIETLNYAINIIKYAQKNKNKLNDLWIYNRESVFNFVRWHTTDAEAAAMTAETGGKTPFSGNSGVHGQWRIFPFKLIMSEFASDTSESCDNSIWKRFLYYVNTSFDTFETIRKELDRTAPATGQVAILSSENAATVNSRRVINFVDHINDLRSKKDHIYGMMPPEKQIKISIPTLLIKTNR